ncbi:ATP synthase subunit gamma, mitochondrial [Ceratocystis lukuohia]|uniref:ATP synthase subunit gamma n=2 Tax=Ceratocystis TaxID=5157 RepID=A0A2C5WXH6_9PEZI|nr:ATP synthase subunit gamma, mitochondrial [Ceratocystis fimbriata CBS 114723]
MFSRAARPAVRAVAPKAVASAPNAAGYATLREIEGRLKSIRNIAKITNTMKVVASTKLNQAQRAMNSSRSYGETSNEVYKHAETAAIKAEGETKKTLLIICSSDKGLCGGVHSGLSRTVRRMALEKPDTYEFVVVGEKAKAQLSRSNPKDLVLSVAGIGKGVPTFSDAQAIADQIVKLPNQYSEIKILYNKFINATSYEPTIIDAFSEDAILASPKLSAYEVEEEAIANLREYGLANGLFWALAEGHACEISARRNAMDNATKNAGEMISKNQILYNRTRQAVITGELVEIITGATASEDM